MSKRPYFVSQPSYLGAIQRGIWANRPGRPTESGVTLVALGPGSSVEISRIILRDQQTRYAHLGEVG